MEIERRQFLKTAGAGACLAALKLPSVSADPGSAMPNIVLCMADDQGWGDLSIHGNQILSTPVLDQLAAESVRFDRFYVCPVCAPTRASLLTGRYHLRTGTSWVTHRKEVMRSEEYTLAESFHDNGYKTACIGKWHNGEQYPNDPLGQGFDEFFGFINGASAYFINDNPRGRLLRGETPVEKEDEYLTDAFGREAVSFIERNKDNKFLLYLSLIHI